MTDYRSLMLRDAAQLDQAVFETIEQIVGGIQNTIDEIDKKLLGSIKDPENFYMLLPLLRSIPSADAHVKELSEYATKIMKLRKSPILLKYEIDLSNIEAKYQAKVLQIFAAYKKEILDLLISMQFKFAQMAKEKKKREDDPIVA